MSFNNLGDFNDPELTEDDGFAPIPNGTYSFIVDSAKTETSRSGYDQIVLQCKIEGPKYQGRMVFERLITGFQDPMGDNNKKAVNMGKAKLKTLCKLNRLNRWPKDEREVVGWRFSADLGHREYEGNFYEEIKKFKEPQAATGPAAPSAIYLKAKASYEAEQSGSPAPSNETTWADDAPF
jgi:hypothetical protein